MSSVITSAVASTRSGATATRLSDNVSPARSPTPPCSGTAGTIFVTSLALLLEALLSPPPATVATLVTFAGAAVATFTVRVIGGYVVPAASTSLLVQLRVASVQLQPIPSNPVAVNPCGNVSVTVTTPAVGPVPLLPIVTM